MLEFYFLCNLVNVLWSWRFKDCMASDDWYS